MAKSGKKVSAVKAEKKASAARVDNKEVLAESLERKVKNNKGGKAKGNAVPGSPRGIESMFRNAYRAQLGMITLAATKANIMISLNGSLLALLTLAGAYILTNEPRLLVPTVVFLLTCIVSIFFAVLAAQPQRVAKTQTQLNDFRKGRADILVFEHFAELSKDEHMTAMMELLQNQEGVYKAMVAHLYFLGSSASRRFKLLRVSYSTFFGGLVVTVLAFAVMRYVSTVSAGV